MPQGPNIVTPIVQAFLSALAAQGIQVERAMLFGSWARGEAKEGSDIDLLVVSPDFSGMPAWRRWEVLGKAAAQVMEPVEALAYSPEELDLCLEREGNFVRHVLTREQTIDYVGKSSEEEARAD